MKRPIEFRGKRVDNGEWVEGLIQHGFDGDINIRTHEVFEDKEYFTTTLVIPETVGQFTGLTDKNEKKIFEGDKICFIDSEDCSTENGYDWREISLVGEILWCDERHGWTLSNRESVEMDELEQYEIEVIGNIHDNPELLKQESNER